MKQSLAMMEKQIELLTLQLQAKSLEAAVDTTKVKAFVARKLSATASVDKFKGHVVLILTGAGKDRPFSFGKTKARLIVDNVAAVQQFVKEYGS